MIVISFNEISLYLCGNVAEHNYFVSSTVVVLLDVIFCITINWTKCLKINLDLEHEVLCIIGININ